MENNERHAPRAALMFNKVFRGTVVLTAAGILTRIIGFGYRILLAGSLGETNLGIYQLIFPIHGICFTLYAAGIQTSVSQLVSQPAKRCSVLKSGLILSLIVSGTLSVILTIFSDTVGRSFLGSAETAPLLRILALIFPFCGVTSIINGYFYGIGNASVPAAAQIIEQLFRVGFVCGAGFLIQNGILTNELAVMGLAAGELASNFYNLFRLAKHIRLANLLSARCCFKNLLRMTLPLSGNRLVISLLGSLESVLIPAMLIKYGMDRADALAVFGVLTGIVMPFIMFPGTITNSLSVLLLPAISRAAGQNADGEVRRKSETAVHYSLILGIYTASVFLVYGQSFGTLLFNSTNAGKLLTLLAVLCPFLYTCTTFNSVINGLGKTGITFLFSSISLSMRIACLLVLTPRFGVFGYLSGLVLSQVLLCLLSGIWLHRKTQTNIQLFQSLVTPSVFSICALTIAKKGSRLLAGCASQTVLDCAGLLAASLFIAIFFIKSKLISKEDFV